MPSSPPFHFQLLQTDNTTDARRGVLTTPRGTIQTPVFMPVGTLATVKGVTIDHLESTGAEIILANTYHLAIRPGHEVVRSLGGVHGMSGWKRPILTDSGGFQVFSLSRLNRVTEDAATFHSHIDGRKIVLSPEHSIEIQQSLASDIMMQMDHVIGLPAPRADVADAMYRSVRWAKRCLAVATRDDQTLFAIVQGGLDADLRRESATALADLGGFGGYAIGGLSVGEPPPDMYRMIQATSPHLPTNQPRYLMGVGRPIDMIESVARGVDMFDCVMPTRNGRNAMAFTSRGPVKIRNAKFSGDLEPLDPECSCLACTRHTRGYLRHLFVSKEMLGPMLLSLHNLTYYCRLMKDIRTAIENERFDQLLQHHRQLWAKH
ncbi:MAG: tRNA guanosine(34) transglycosylase Tgt [Planctomycetota bacterium]